MKRLCLLIFHLCAIRCYCPINGHHDRNALRILWDVNDGVVYYGMLVRSFCGECCTYACTSSLLDCCKSTLHDVQNHDVSLNLSYSNDCLLSVISTEKMLFCLSNSCVFDPTIYVVCDLPMFRLIPDCNMSLDIGAIIANHSQLVPKVLGASWVMFLKQSLSWLNFLGSLII